MPIAALGFALGWLKGYRRGYLRACRDFVGSYARATSKWGDVSRG